VSIGVCVLAPPVRYLGIGAGQQACRRRVMHFSHGHRVRLSNVSTKHLFEACLPFLEHPC
jgi:hypothetical protein